MPRAVYLLGLAIFAQGTSELMLAGLLPEIATDLNVSMEAKGRVDAMMVDIAKVNEHVAQSLQELSTVLHQMHTDVGVAVRALQFEDIISQLLHYTEKSLGTLRCLGTALAEATETNDSTQLLALGTTLAHLRKEGQPEAHKPVV